MLAIGAAAGAASFTHVHNVAAAHGQPGWLAWADAIVLELMSIASGLELRRRKRTHASTVFPAAVLSCAVTLSLAAQVVEAEPSPIGWIAAAVPALGFLVMVKVALGNATTPTRTGAAPSTSQIPDRTEPTTHHGGQTDKTLATATAGERSTARTVRPSSAGQQPGGPDRRRRTADRGRPPRRSADELLPAARRVRDHLAVEGRALTRGELAQALRGTGHTVSNTRASALLKAIKAESPSLPEVGNDRTPPTPEPPPLTDQQPAANTNALDGTQPAPRTHATGTTTLDPTNPRHPQNGQENRS